MLFSVPIFSCEGTFHFPAGLHLRFPLKALTGTSSPPLRGVQCLSRRSCARIRLAGDRTPPATALQSIPFWIPDPEGEVSIVFIALGRTWKSTLLIIGDDQCLHRRPSRARFSSAVLSQLSDPSSDNRGRNRSNWHYWSRAHRSRAHIGGTVAERFTQAGHGAALRSVSWRIFRRAY